MAAELRKACSSIRLDDGSAANTRIHDQSVSEGRRTPPLITRPSRGAHAGSSTHSRTRSAVNRIAVERGVEQHAVESLRLGVAVSDSPHSAQP